MNFVQTWFGKSEDINDKRKECMNSVLKRVGKNDKYYMIGNPQDKFSKSKKITWIDHNKYFEEVLNKYSFIKEFWDKLLDECKEGHLVKADIIRFVFLHENKDVLYFDTDIELQKKPTFKKNFHLANYGSFLDYCMMYKGKKDEPIILEILENAIQNSWKYYRNKYKVGKSWIAGTLKRMAKEKDFNQSPVDTFIHQQQGCR